MEAQLAEADRILHEPNATLSLQYGRLIKRVSELRAQMPQARKFAELTNKTKARRADTETHLAQWSELIRKIDDTDLPPGYVDQVRTAELKVREALAVAAGLDMVDPEWPLYEKQVRAALSGAEKKLQLASVRAQFKAGPAAQKSAAKLLLDKSKETKDAKERTRLESEAFTALTHCHRAGAAALKSSPALANTQLTVDGSTTRADEVVAWCQSQLKPLAGSVKAKPTATARK
jgi:hypothetical protein